MKYVVANIKMNKSYDEMKSYLIGMASRFSNDKVDLTIAMPYTYISLGKFLLEGSAIRVGGQNLSEDEEGKSTGEISGRMLRSSGAENVIIGHSERRKKFKEDGKSINLKIKSALKNRLNIILCIGESASENKLGKRSEVIKEQIESAFKGLYENELDNILIAYEPIWAIGTGVTPTAKEIGAVAKEIRKIISDDFSASAGEKMRVLYGGSVNGKSIGQIKNVKGVDGFLVGGACLDGGEFLQILNNL